MAAAARATSDVRASQRAEHGFYKQAIWAWTKYIKAHRRDHHAHRDRVAAYEAYIDQQAGAGSIQRLARMAVEAVRSMLRSFPGDAFAASKMPLVLYKAGKSSQCAAALHCGTVSVFHLLVTWLQLRCATVFGGPPLLCMSLSL
jgi:hypothetical protein